VTSARKNEQFTRHINVCTSRIRFDHRDLESRPICVCVRALLCDSTSPRNKMAMRALSVQVPRLVARCAMRATIAVRPVVIARCMATAAPAGPAQVQVRTNFSSVADDGRRHEFTESLWLASSKPWLRLVWLLYTCYTPNHTVCVHAFERFMAAVFP
jgi:hypothetical protein